MNRHLIDRCSRAPLTGAVAMLCFLGMSSSVMSAERGMQFDGAGFGPTIEIAIQSAIGDAEVSASAYQRYSCRLASEPRIFPGPNRAWSRNFRAQVTIECTP